MTTNKAEMHFVSAATYSLEALADIFTRSFEGYFYPGVTTAQLLSGRARFEHIDFAASLVMIVDRVPAGIALLALRGERAWCGGFGVTATFRGRGLARELAKAMVERARAAGASRLSLEVLTRNEKAVNTYLGVGLQVQRDLHIFEWSAQDNAVKGTENTKIQEVEPRVLLAHFDRLHAVRAGWQRDLPALLVKGDLRGVALMRDDAPAAYALFSQRDEHHVRVEDLGALNAAEAVALLQTLQRQATHIVSINEPSDSITFSAYAQAGFKETDRQHEMERAL